MRRICFLPSLACLALLSLALVSAGCSKSTTLAETSASASGTELAATQTADAYPGKGGAQAWVDNCMRCHNLRPPQERSDREWTLIVHHMRVRANLTAQEHRLILEFLQSAN